MMSDCPKCLRPLHNCMCGAPDYPQDEHVYKPMTKDNSDDGMLVAEIADIIDRLVYERGQLSPNESKQYARTLIAKARQHDRQRGLIDVHQLRSAILNLKPVKHDRRVFYQLVEKLIHETHKED